MTNEMPGPSRPKVDHVFVVMLENRSFDHMFAFSGIGGITKAPPSASNSYGGHEYPITAAAPATMPTDPGHEFADAVEQLCGPGVSHQPWTPFPTAIDSSGFVANYATTRSEISPGNPTLPAEADYGDVMACFDTASQLPVLHQLATEFAVCDHWFSSLPGPTWPNRLFLHGASSAGWADSPSGEQLGAWWKKSAKFTFPSGVSIFDRLTAAGLSWRIYADEDGPTYGGIPLVAALANIAYGRDTFPYSQFDADLAGTYEYTYTFIEPNYGDVVSGSFKGGSSQHPMDGVDRGEALIKSTYESIRKSPLWERSMMVVLYDEHGGFYDSVAPGVAPPPGDGSPQDISINSGGFLFDRYGVRVPAVVVSPLVPKGTVDPTVYDHASVPATLERLFGLDPMTERDKAANDLRHLLSAAEPRSDCPVTLVDAPPPAPSSPAAAPTADANTIHGAGRLRLAVLGANDVAACTTEADRDAARRAHDSVRTPADATSYAAGAMDRTKGR